MILILPINLKIIQRTFVNSLAMATGHNVLIKLTSEIRHATSSIAKKNPRMVTDTV